LSFFVATLILWWYLESTSYRAFSKDAGTLRYRGYNNIAAPYWKNFSCSCSVLGGKAPMNVADIMTTDVVTVSMDDSLEKINRIFEKHKFHHVLVMEEEKLIGIISDRDVLKTISPFIKTLSESTRDIKTLGTKAHQLMTRKPVTVIEDSGVKEAVNVFLKQNVSCLPVVSSSGRVTGVLSWKDILRAHYLRGQPPG
jgi:acetoin utilization protein AcuB